MCHLSKYNEKIFKGLTCAVYIILFHLFLCPYLKIMFEQSEQLIKMLLYAWSSILYKILFSGTKKLLFFLLNTSFRYTYILSVSKNNEIK